MMNDVVSLDGSVRRLQRNDPEMTSLRMEGSEITQRLRFRFRKALSKSSHLEELILSRNQLFATWSLEKLHKLFDCIAMCQSLSRLRITLNELDANAVQYLTTALILTPSDLQVLDLSFNGIGDTGARHISGIIQSTFSLQVLVLDGTSIGDGGAIALSRGLTSQVQSQLRVLSLKDNHIGPDGGSALAKAVSSSNLEELVLNFNSIENQGATDLAEALATNPPLRRVHLGANNIGPEGGTSLAGSLLQNSNLQVLDLSFVNPIERSSIQAFTDVLKYSNETLFKLTLWNRYRSDSSDLQFYVSLNRMGRQHIGDVNLPQGYWPLALGRISKDCQLLYFFVRERPDLLR